MAYYRLYLLEDTDGGFVGFEEIDAPDDDAALRQAEESKSERLRELWCGGRKIGRIPASSH